MALRFHLDENVSRAVAEGLRRRAIDVTTAPETGLLGAADIQHLEFARQQRRVIFTSDTDFLILAANGEDHAGIAYAEMGSRTLGHTIEMLILMDACFSQEEMRNRIEFI